MSGPRSRRIPLLSLLLLVLCCHVGSGFVLDDYFHLDRASRPFGVESLRFAIHTDDYGIVLWPRDSPVHLDFLRPASMTSFWIEYRVWRLSAFGYHLDNLLLHLLNVWLLFCLARRLGLSVATSTLVAVAWGLSLQSTPAVGWISGRTELLCALFTLSAVLALDQWSKGGSHAWYAAALLLTALAPLAKETGVVAPILMLIAGRIQSPGKLPSRLGIWSSSLLFLPAGVYVWLRFAVLKIPPPHQPYLESFGTATDILWLCMKPILYAFAALFSLPISHISPLTTLHQHPQWFLLLAACLLLVLSRLIRVAGSRRTMWMLAWFVVALLPCLPVLPTSLYLYLPLAGLAILLGLARDGNPTSPWATRWLAAWCAIGIVAHLFIAAFTASAARALARATVVAEAQVSRQSATRLLLVDVPVWAYGLPAGVHLYDPKLRFESWILNFSPRIWPGTPSQLRWQNPLLLQADAPGGRYFDSPVERFLLFGASPADTNVSHAVGPLQIRSHPDTATPRSLLISFRDEATLGQCAILQFRGWEAAPLASWPPAFSPSGAGGRHQSIASGVMVSPEAW